MIVCVCLWVAAVSDSRSSLGESTDSCCAVYVNYTDNVTSLATTSCVHHTHTVTVTRCNCCCSDELKLMIVCVCLWVAAVSDSRSSLGESTDSCCAVYVNYTDNVTSVATTSCVAVTELRELVNRIIEAPDTLQQEFNVSITHTHTHTERSD